MTRLAMGRGLRGGRPILLGQAPAGMREIEIDSTWWLLPGDAIRISFPFGSRGWVKYGGSELFTVTAVDPTNGEVSVVDESGAPGAFAGGEKADLLARLAETTSYSDVRVYRLAQRRAVPPALFLPALDDLPEEVREEAEEIYEQCLGPDLAPDESEG